MKICTTEDIFEELGLADMLCITTNCQFRNDGMRVVCGAGIALQATKMWPNFEFKLGEHKLNISQPNLVLRHFGTEIWSFPTKYHWRDTADYILIVNSTRHILSVANDKRFDRIAIPAPGCGLGGLSWHGLIKPMLEEILDDRFIVYKKET